MDTSAWVINVLSAAGQKGHSAVASAKTYILSVQQADGGFGFTKDKSTSADSTGLVLSAIQALGERTTKAPWRQDDGGDPVKALLPLQDSSGGFRFTSSTRSPNGLSTQQRRPGAREGRVPDPEDGHHGDAEAVEGTDGGARTRRRHRARHRVRRRRAAPPAPRAARRRQRRKHRPARSRRPVARGPVRRADPRCRPAGRSCSRRRPARPSPTRRHHPDETIPAPVLWAGLGGVIVLTGGGTYLFRRWRRPATPA